MVEHPLIVWRVVGSITHGGSIQLYVILPSAIQMYNKGYGMYYPVCGMVHIKEPLLLIKKISHVVGAGLLSYVWRHITINNVLSVLLNKNAI